MADGQAPQWISCHYVMSDDGQSAVVEFVGTNRQALKPVLEAARAGSIQAFEPNKISAANLHNTLKRLKANFDWSAFRGVPATSTSPATSLPVGGAN